MQRHGFLSIKDETFDLPGDDKIEHKPYGEPSKKMLREKDRRIAQRAGAQAVRHKPKYTAEELDAKRSPHGGWTRRQLAKWGVPWPPPKGWRKALIAGENPKSREGRARAMMQHFTEPKAEQSPD